MKHSVQGEITISRRAQVQKKKSFTIFFSSRRRPSPGRRRHDDEVSTRPLTYPARPKGAKPDEKKDSGTAPEQPAKKKEDNPLLMNTGGAYIPPARLRMMQ